MRSSHDEHPRQYVDEHPSHPRRHRMRLRRPEVDIQHHYRDAYTEKIIK